MKLLCYLLTAELFHEFAEVTAQAMQSSHFAQCDDSNSYLSNRVRFEPSTLLCILAREIQP